MDTRRKLPLAIFAAIFLYISAASDSCNPNPCKHHGQCQTSNNTTKFTCVCAAPSEGITCEIDNGLQTDWLLSLAFSIPISVLILVGVLILYKIQSDKLKQRQQKNDLEIDYDVPSVVMSPHDSPLDTPSNSQYGNEGNENEDAMTQL